jgi:hypothetical protein
MSNLTVGQFRRALQLEKPVLYVQASQDKIRMEHYVPLHPELVKILQPLVDGRADDELLFWYHSLLMWLKREKIPLTRISDHFVLGDLRKFAEQYGDIIQWDQSNRALFLLTAYRVLSGRTIDIRCLNMCMTFTCDIGKMCGSRIRKR